jgi:hypothetical protein
MGHAHKGYFSPKDLKEMREELARGDTKGESKRERELRAIAIVRHREGWQPQKAAREDRPLRHSGLNSFH